MSHGVRVVGVDISMEMLRKLVAKAGSVPVAIADATRLPFQDRTFTSAIASHVLHLIPAWKAAVDELMRAVVPGGVLIASRGANSGAEWQRAVRARFFEEAGGRRRPPGIDRITELDEEMRRRGAGVREIEDVRSEGVSTVTTLVDALERGIYSACWAIDEDVRRRAAVKTREWATSQLGDLNEPRPTRHSSDWRAYVLPE
jgi:SAM-dependent methyltransferase